MTRAELSPAGPGTDEITLPLDGEWRRLDPRMLVVHPTLDLSKLLPVLAIVMITGGTSDDRWQLGIGALLAVAILVGGVLRWVTTTYRIGDERVELRTGLLRRRHRSVHRDRIRTADLTSSLVHRVFGLAVVRVGTGSHDGGEDAELRLDAVGHADAEGLRRLLLRTAPHASPADTGADEPEVARLNWAWIRYAPLTFSGLAVVGAVWAGLLRVAEETRWRPQDARQLAFVGEAPLLWGAVALLVIAVLGAGAIFVEGWWGYRLTRTACGGLVVRRGLLTRRSLTLEGRRIRGVELDEPLLLRLGRGARALALTSGLRAQREGSGSEHVGALAPAVPRVEAHRILAAALGVPPETSTASALLRHPPAARRRRFVRALVPMLLLGVAASFLPWTPVAWVTVPVALFVGVGLGVARWAALGHALTDTHLVSRHGALVRRTVVLRRDGVIGWRLHQSLFQRRAGLVTLVAVSAAGRGHYEVLDVGVDRALELVEATSTGLLDPFLITARGPSGALSVRTCG